jgi:Flp pilus assembly protein TadD
MRRGLGMSPAVCALCAKRTLIATMGVMCLWGQTGTTTGTTGTTGTGSSTGTAAGTSAGSTNTSAPSASGSPGAAGPKPIFLSGMVMMDDGSPLPGSVDIQSICGTFRRTMGHSSSSGNFGFQWSSTSSAFGDASQAGRVSAGSGGASLTGSRNGSRGLDPLANCDLLAAFPGYSSTRVSLYDRGGQDNFDVGAIVLHRIAAGEGHVVSVLALRAPKEAKKSFEKGTSLAAANKPAEAVTSFEKAVAIYPQYADAWLGLGKAQWQMGRKGEAGTSFAKSVELDNKLVGPWQELGYLACDDSRWDDAVRYLDQAVRLDPMDSPIAWYFSALAYYNLGHFDQAERSVRAELKLDHGQNPRADYLLGLVLIARKDLQGAAQALRNYIAAAPASPEVASARRELSRVENQLGN